LEARVMGSSLVPGPISIRSANRSQRPGTLSQRALDRMDRKPPARSLGPPEARTRSTMRWGYHPGVATEMAAPYILLRTTRRKILGSGTHEVGGRGGNSGPIHPKSNPDGGLDPLAATLSKATTDSGPRDGPGKLSEPMPSRESGATHLPHEKTSAHSE